MKLYFAPHTCALSPHIALIELGLPYELVKIDNRSKRTEDGRDFLKISPKGYVPALELDSGEILTEGPVITQYLSDLKPEIGLAPANGTLERVGLQEWLHYLGTEIHGSCGPLFNPGIPDDVKTIFKDKLLKRVRLIEEVLEKQDYLMGSRFTPADGYLFTMLRWFAFFKIDYKQWPGIARFMERVGARPAVKQAIELEEKA